MTSIEITTAASTAAAVPTTRPLREVLRPSWHALRRVAAFARSVVAWGDQQPPHAQYANGGYPY